MEPKLKEFIIGNKKLTDEELVKELIKNKLCMSNSEARRLTSFRKTIENKK